MLHHTQLIFAFLVEKGFYHVVQVCLELLTTSDLPTSASQSAGITGMSLCTWPSLLHFIIFFFFEMESCYISRQECSGAMKFYNTVSYGLNVYVLPKIHMLKSSP